ncbi:nucleoside hydrolase [Neobacillus notoginsengisoli]|uniref:Nucleoside hydrolase n=1 Tax=Neobacillus notoginsengisoli TaxID=1578198 RepID=A0A417YSR8_9BACI|nr:nucleoside hydrolase [Neobacillus notoginsengisoli]RHW39000.1 nucleoside hydrolase [Neobacillus notoginsengisoli]
MKKVIIDVDTGVDDALAILYAVQSEQLDILGITAVSGNVPLEQVTINTNRMLNLIGINDKITVYKGASRPLLREPFHEFRVHGEDGIGGALDHIDMEIPENEVFAADFIIEQAKKHKGELTLIMVGPLTNLALAIRKEPRLAEWVKDVVIMGGIVESAGRGNTLPTSEFNIFADPESAKIVFHSGLEMTLVSLDVTRKVMLMEEHINELEGTKYFDFVKNSTGIYRNFSAGLYGINGCALHDPLAVGVALDKSFVKTEKYYVDVETKSDLSYGQTIVDFRGLLKKEPNVNICTDVDHERFLKMFLDCLKK